MLLLLFYLLLALFISFICSIMEAVLLSTPRSFLLVKQKKGRQWAARFIELKQNINRPLSAILSMNTIAHTVGAAGVGAQAVKVFGDASFGIVSAILTILILVITEIIPKTVGARYWRGLAGLTAYAIRITMVITYPLVIMASFITRNLSRKYQEPTTSREEISAMTDIGADEGIFNEKEHKIINNLLMLKNVKVTEVMTPRTVAVIADEETKLEDFLVNKEYLHFSRIPVYAQHRENITGYVFRHAVFEEMTEGHSELQLKDIKRDIVIVPNSQPLFAVWEKLLEKKEHIALIVDEYGGMDGIITMEDVIETILGLEIVDEKDVVTDMQQYAKERWEKRKSKYNLL